MNRTSAAAVLVAFAVFAGLAARTGSAAPSAADLEKEKAMKDPYANDLGPDKVDVSSYPKDIQEGYKALTVKCAKCHSAARPLNSQFVETAGKDEAERKKSLEALKKSDPDLFKDKAVWQVEDGIWQRYVKRMMAKPGCDISKDEGKKIWQFIAHDSRERKLKKKAEWAAARQKMLADFKAKHAHRYEELYGKKN